MSYFWDFCRNFLVDFLWKLNYNINIVFQSGGQMIFKIFIFISIFFITKKIIVKILAIILLKKINTKNNCN